MTCCSPLFGLPPQYVLMEKKKNYPNFLSVDDSRSEEYTSVLSAERLLPMLLLPYYNRTSMA